MRRLAATCIAWCAFLLFAGASVLTALAEAVNGRRQADVPRADGEPSSPPAGDQ